MPVSRRSFLSSAATSVAAPMVVPSSVFGAEAPSNRVHLAAIGVGGRGFRNGIHHFLPLKGVRFLAAVDCFRDRREKFAARCNKEYGRKVCEPRLSYRDVLARRDIDGVVVSTPDHWHAPIAAEAARAGKHMYVEKPLSPAIAWSEKLRDAVEASGVVFQYGTQQRSMRSSQIAVDLVRNGYIGDVQRADVWSPSLDNDGYGRMVKKPAPDGLAYPRWLGPAPWAPYTPDRVASKGAYHIYDYSLGFIAGWGAHPLDLLQWGLGRDHTSPVRYEGEGRFPPEGRLSDTICRWDVRMAYDDGLPVRFMSDDVAEPIVKRYHPRWRADGTTFHGTEGWVSVSRRACYMKRGGKMVNTTTFEFREGDARVYNGQSHPGNFVDAIRGEAEAVNPVGSAFHSDAISHLSDICIRAGRPIRWDPKAERIVDDPEAAKMLDRPVSPPWSF